MTPQHLAVNAATQTMNVPAGLLPEPEKNNVTDQ
jgi:hypothetical protein